MLGLFTADRDTNLVKATNALCWHTYYQKKIKNSLIALSFYYIQDPIKSNYEVLLVYTVLSCISAGVYFTTQTYDRLLDINFTSYIIKIVVTTLTTIFIKLLINVNSKIYI